MAFNIEVATAIIQIAKKCSFHGHLVNISKPLTNFTYRDFLAALDQEWPDHSTPFDINFLRTLDNIVDSDLMFKILGFSSITNISYFEEYDNGFRFDLNSDTTPEQITEIADAVFDFGTSEHIFHIPNMLCNMGRIAKPQAIILHHASCNNHINHGFYQFSPTFYYDYYLTNKYEVLGMFLNVFKVWHKPGHKFLIINRDAAGNEFSIKEEDALKRVMALFIARKLVQSTVGVWPQQSFYIKAASENPDRDLPVTDLPVSGS